MTLSNCNSYYLSTLTLIFNPDFELSKPIQEKGITAQNEMIIKKIQLSRKADYQVIEN